eukprot:COSAG02_NODE_14190_length_1299_cov_1.485833_2_plen_29_part_01
MRNNAQHMAQHMAQQLPNRGKKTQPRWWQ